MKFAICLFLFFLLCDAAEKEMETNKEKEKKLTPEEIDPLLGERIVHLSLSDVRDLNKSYVKQMLTFTGHHALEQYESDSAKEFFQVLMKDRTFHEFTSEVEVPRAELDCYYEDCQEGSEFITAFQVKTPPSFKSNGLITASIRYPNSTVAVQTDKPTLEGNLEVFCPVAGVYGFCLENTVDRLSSKRVSFNMIVMHHEEVADFHMAQQADENDTVYHLYDKLYQVFHDLAKVKIGVTKQNAKAGRDKQLMDDNNALVAEFSIAMMILVCGVTFGQVYFLKRLFRIDERPVNGSSRKI